MRAMRARGCPSSLSPLYRDDWTRSTLTDQPQPPFDAEEDDAMQRRKEHVAHHRDFGLSRLADQ